MRIGVYADLVFRTDGESLSANRAFVKFVTALPPRLAEVVLFGRLDPEPGLDPYVLPSDAIRFVALPHYASLSDAPGLARALRESLRVFDREVRHLDAVWLFGPHPLALAFAAAARRRRVPVFLGVRQDFPQYIANRAEGRQRLWAIPAAHGLESTFRLLARRAPTVVVGDDLARQYGRGAAVLSTGFSLIREADVVPAATALERDWSAELRLLTVGRLDPEKNPLLLADIVARLPERVVLDVVGEGPLLHALEARATELGVGDRVRLLGYVANGPALWERYRAAHAFLHVSLTEGLPQVLFEAQAAGLPVVATDVGGVRAALADGATGLLVPPEDADAAAGAVRRLIDDAPLRTRLIEDGIAHARTETLDAQLDRIAAFFEAHR